MNPSTINAARRQVIAAIVISLTTPLWAKAPDTWRSLEAQANGQTVYLNACAGSPNINAYLRWIAVEVKKHDGITLKHVKSSDLSEVVKRLRNEKPAGKLNSDGVDLAWINGENFLPMKCEGVLFAPFTHHLPNFKEIDVVGKPTTTIDFSEPRQSLEMPWSMTQLTFFADSKRISRRLEGMAELLAFAQANPAQVSHPRPSDLHGTTFLKQALLEASPDRRAVYKPVSPQARKANISTWGDSTVLAVDHLS